MSRYIDADAFIENATAVYCENCERRMGIKNGKKKAIYEIGEAPCRACDVDDMKNDIENAPTADVVEVVRCKDCKHRDDDGMCCGRGWPIQLVADDGFCDKGERREDD